MVDQLTAPDPPSFFWGNAPPDSPLSYQALQTRRKIAEALASKRSPFPKNAGEGLTYLGESLGDIMAMRSLDAQERAYEAEGNRSATEAARTLYGASPGGSAASAPAYGASPGGPAASAPALPPDTQATDTAPSSAVNMAAGGTPLPPPRPIYDRTALNQQVQDNPNLIPQWAAMIKGEGGNPAIQAETPANRMVTQGVPLARALETVKTGGYYPPETYQYGYQQSPEDVARIKRAYIDPVLRGASPSTEALRFPATGNASNEPGNRFASRRAAAGIYNRSAWDPGGSGEMYVQQDTPAMQARLAATSSHVTRLPAP